MSWKIELKDLWEQVLGHSGLTVTAWDTRASQQSAGVQVLPRLLVQLLTNAPGRQQAMAQALGSSLSCGSLGWSSWLLASSWTRPFGD